MKSKKFLWFLLRLNLIVWLAAAATTIWLNGAEAAPEKVTLCHFGETKQVPSRAVQQHLDHGDYLGVCVAPTPEPESTPASESSAHPLYTMWLLTDNQGWDCLIISDTHPSIERQGALCFPTLDPDWRATSAPCAAPVMSDGSWKCDAQTPWRLR